MKPPASGKQLGQLAGEVANVGRQPDLLDKGPGVARLHSRVSLPPPEARVNRRGFCRYVKFFLFT